MIVLDSSVVFKWIFVDEENSPLALNLREGHIKGEQKIAIVPLFYFEIANILATKSSLLSNEAEEAFSEIYNFELEEHNLELENYKRAISLANEKKISVYDASYIVLAEKLACDFVTADEKLVAKLKDLEFVKLLG